MLDFPFLGLLVSGGHCQLLLCEGVGKYTVLGGTMDDALGEAYDKASCCEFERKAMLVSLLADAGLVLQRFKERPESGSNEG